MKEKRCPDCGEGVIKPTKKPGRTSPYKNLASVEIPSEFEIPTCNHCGAEYLDGPATDALETVLAAAYDEKLKRRADDANAKDQK